MGNCANKLLEDVGVGSSLARSLFRVCVCVLLSRSPALCCYCICLCRFEQALLTFEVWKAKHGVSYSDEDEEAQRFTIFSESLTKVAAHNEHNDQLTLRTDGQQDEAGFVLGLNRFADMTWCVRKSCVACAVVRS